LQLEITFPLFAGLELDEEIKAHGGILKGELPYDIGLAASVAPGDENRLTSSRVERSRSRRNGSWTKEWRSLETKPGCEKSRL